MNDDALSLLDGAADVLRAMAPALSGEGRYAVLLSANAVATARRGVAMRDRSEAARAAVAVEVGAIRAGAHDDDTALYDRLLVDAAVRAWIADPAALSKPERDAFLGGCA